MKNRGYRYWHTEQENEEFIERDESGQITAVCIASCVSTGKNFFARCNIRNKSDFSFSIWELKGKNAGTFELRNPF